ncbi:MULTISPECIES: shikimate dehydrogenase [unclassified Pseudomonas]|uniref:shikimate dehydrogenase family protein n=1 Tax=unclassified Pseudomonas TaxID=196821 RepID=UPI000D3A9CEC|nr:MULTISPECIES: shikimate dehydrogenase [unclassified Pseudomonas]RAU47839.1 shikimate dehydrogenase [Pseudomonas sp. RIT 409]RAU55467.1 shikimate dehydrogenase [Pseudomonas sp. RIT 412]
MNTPMQNVRVDGATRLFGIVGHPVAQVKTPQLLNARFDASRLNAVCVPFDAPVEHFEAIVQGLKSLANLDGLVITVPHKISAMALVDRLSPAAQRVGAINAMRREADGTWLGDMFDGTGLLQGLAPLGFQLAGQRVKQIGAGGAGAAVAHALAQAGAASLAVSDPRQAALSELVERLRHFYPDCKVDIDHNPADVTDTDLLINCSPVGMGTGDGMPVAFGAFPAALQVVDIIMTPAETPLLKHARRFGCNASNGLPMIHGQLEAFARFFRVDPAEPALSTFSDVR